MSSTGGNTQGSPLHYAAYVGNADLMIALLDFPEDEMGPSTTSGTGGLKQRVIDAQYNIGELQIELPRNWSDLPDHDYRNITIPFIQPGWTALHVASACTQSRCVYELLGYGANPNVPDLEGRTPLDVAGYASCYGHQITVEGMKKVIAMLLKNGTFNTMRAGGLDNVDTPLHTVVYLESEAVFKQLLRAGASMACLNKAGKTPLHVCVEKHLDNFLQLSTTYGSIEVKDVNGRSVLRAAVDDSWGAGVHIALQAKADITSKANDGETPITAAAAVGHYDILEEILYIARQRNELDSKNEKGDTALFKAVTNGHVDCVDLILSEGADTTITQPGELNVLHVAVDNNKQNILELLLKYDDIKDLINSPTVVDEGKKLYGFCPIHMALMNTHVDCVDLLLRKGANIKQKASGLTTNPTPLHIAAIINRVDIAQMVLKFDKTTINEFDSKGLLPLHAAGKQSSRETIALLLKEGADLSAYTEKEETEEDTTVKKRRRTAIDMIMNNISKPTEFFEDIFDSYISSNGQDLQDHNCEVTVDYRVLIPPGSETKQLAVIEAILKTGNRFNQRRLLVHPLVESFLYLKWKALVPFFYAMIFIHSLFVTSLTILIGSTFYYFDTNNCPPSWLHPRVWCLFSVISFGLKFFQDFHLGIQHHFYHKETWVKLGAVVSASLIFLIMPCAPFSNGSRYISTIALLLSWLDMLCLISRFPDWGYHVLMFGKVTWNVIKILLTFISLIIGFSFGFMILVRSEIPFNGLWPAIVKTVVMMTSEFDYGNIFDEEHSESLADTIILLRIVFLIFLIVAAIALMNLLTAVAVNDVNELKVFGNIKRLTKQVAFLATFETVADNKIFNKILPVKFNKILEDKHVELCPRRPTNILPSKMQDSIYNLAQKQVKETKDRHDNESLNIDIKKIINYIQSIINKNENIPSSDENEINNTNIATVRNQVGRDNTNINNFEGVVRDTDVELKSFIEESRSSITDLGKRLDQISGAIQMILSDLRSLKR